MWYVPKLGNHGTDLGRCRRHSPTMGGFPAVFAGDWCGDHKLDETKLEAPEWSGNGPDPRIDPAIEPRDSASADTRLHEHMRPPGTAA